MKKIITHLIIILINFLNKFSDRVSVISNYWIPYTKESYDKIKDKNDFVLACFENVKIRMGKYDSEIFTFFGCVYLDDSVNEKRWNIAYSDNWDIAYSDNWIEQDPIWISSTKNLEKLIKRLK